MNRTNANLVVSARNHIPINLSHPIEKLEGRFKLTGAGLRVVVPMLVHPFEEVRRKWIIGSGAFLEPEVCRIPRRVAWQSIAPLARYEKARPSSNT